MKNPLAKLMHRLAHLFGVAKCVPVFCERHCSVIGRNRTLWWGWKCLGCDKYGIGKSFPCTESGKCPCAGETQAREKI